MTELASRRMGEKEVEREWGNMRDSQWEERREDGEGREETINGGGIDGVEVGREEER